MLNRYLAFFGLVFLLTSPVPAADTLPTGGAREPLVKPWHAVDAQNALKMSVKMIREIASYDVVGDTPNSGPDGKVTARDAQVIAQGSADDSPRAGQGSSTPGGAPASPVQAPSSLVATEATVPNLVGLTKGDAWVAIFQAGFDSQIEDGERPPTAKDADHVYRQSPPDGTKLKEGATVTVTVYGPAMAVTATSTTPDPVASSSAPSSPDASLVVVPQLAGMRKEQAQAALADRKLTPLDGTDNRSAPADNVVGRVYGQSPAAGTKVPPGQTVTINLYAPAAVSTASTPAPSSPMPQADLVTVPNLVGLTPFTAEDNIRLFGLTPLLGERKPETPTTEVGRVYRQSPEAGTKLKRGEVVMVVVRAPDVEPADKPVPNVLGMTGEEAGDALRRAGFRSEISISQSIPPHGDDAGRVIKQIPAAKERKPPGELVHVVTYAPVNVPRPVELTTQSPPSPPVGNPVDDAPRPRRTKRNPGDSAAFIDEPASPSTSSSQPPEPIKAFSGQGSGGPTLDIPPQRGTAAGPYPPGGDTAFVPGGPAGPSNPGPSNSRSVNPLPGGATQSSPPASPREYPRKIYRVDDSQQWAWQQTGAQTGTMTMIFRGEFAAGITDKIREAGYKQDFTFNARLEGEAWVVREQKYRQFSRAIAATLDEALDTSDLEWHIRFVGQEMQTETKFDGQFSESVKGTLE